MLCNINDRTSLSKICSHIIKIVSQLTKYILFAASHTSKTSTPFFCFIIPVMLLSSKFDKYYNINSA